MPKTLFVEDLTCSAKHPVRSHEIPQPNGTVTIHELKYGEKTEMPYADAVQFLKDEAYRVTDAEDERIQPTPPRPATTEKIVLANDQCIARYSELTKDALAVRVAQVPGGHELEKATKPDMVKFLTGAGQKARDRETPEDEIEPDAPIMDELANEIETATA